MPKLSKVQKKVAKKRRDTSSLHENSRDAAKLRRAAARADKLEKLSVARNKAKNPHSMDRRPWTIGVLRLLTVVLVERVAFFKGAATAAAGGLDVGRMQGLVNR